MRFENGIMNLVNFTINTPSATLTHAVNLTINVSGASSITVSSNTYVLIGILQTVNLTVGGSTRFSPQSGSQLVVSGTITKDPGANITPLSGAIISVPQDQLTEITINSEVGVVVADKFVKNGQSIQTAINASEEGDTILVDAGVFNEEIFFNSISNRTLIGSTGSLQTVIAPTRAYAALGNNGITINLSNYITISHLTIDGYANTVLGEVPTFRDGIHYVGPGVANNNTFENLIIKNIDRRGISVFPLTNTNTTIRNNHILNITGDVMGSWNGSVGINFQGSGVVENNLVEQVHTGLVYNSDISSEVTFTLRNNIIRNFKSVEDLSFFGSFNAGFNLWPRKTETIIIEDNLILFRSDYFANKLREKNIACVIADKDRAAVKELRAEGIPAVSGDASDPFVLIQAHIARAAILVIATKDEVNVGKMVETARALNPNIAIYIRAQDSESIAMYEKEGWGKSFTPEEELGNRFAAEVLHKLQETH
jgi:hypothetical protein